MTQQAKASSGAPKLKAKMNKPSDPYVNYSTPASLGYRDPDAEEAQQRMHTGTPGAWTVVTKSVEQEEKPKEEEEIKGGEKRPAEGEEEEEDGRAFKLRKKTVEIGLGEIYDPAKVDPVKTEPSEPARTEPGLFRKRKGRPNNTATKSVDR